MRLLQGLMCLSGCMLPVASFMVPLLPEARRFNPVRMSLDTESVRTVKMPTKAQDAARDMTQGAVVLNKWNYTYSDADARRAASEPIGRTLGLKVLLIGKPCSGKGTQAPLMGRKYRMVHISTGNLLRAEIKAETELGLIAKEQISKGELLPDELMIALVKKRIAQPDCEKNGWILDGFPRTVTQAKLMKRAGIEPDAVIELDRPDDLVREWCMGRYHDVASGVIYHPKFNPPPKEVEGRLVWRMDDTPETLERRLAIYNEKTRPVLDQYPDKTYKIDGCRNELEVFHDVCVVIEESAEKKGLEIVGAEPVTDDFQTDVPAPLEPADKTKSTKSSLRDIVLRCNVYNLAEYLPVVVDKELVGYVSKAFASDLMLLQQGAAVDVVVDHYVRLAPDAGTCDERTRLMEGLVNALVTNGMLPSRYIRNEMMDVKGFVSPGENSLLRLERGAMARFGIPSHGVHVNGFVREGDRHGMRLWIGRRSESKATYPGMFDVLAAGGQPSGLSYRANAYKECEEEASIPKWVLDAHLLSAGVVSYRYQTKNGLSTKFLHIYDLELPSDFTPYNGDGEVEQFFLVDAKEVLNSIQTELYRWKPNAALTVVDFAVRHGFIDGDDHDYTEICHMLRGALATPTPSA